MKASKTFKYLMYEMAVKPFRGLSKRHKLYAIYTIVSFCILAVSVESDQLILLILILNLGNAVRLLNKEEKLRKQTKSTQS